MGTIRNDQPRIVAPAIIETPKVGVPLKIAQPPNPLAVSIRNIYANGVVVATGNRCG
jgi:hypothetical protein